MRWRAWFLCSAAAKDSDSKRSVYSTTALPCSDCVVQDPADLSASVDQLTIAADECSRDLPVSATCSLFQSVYLYPFNLASTRSRTRNAA